LTNLVKSFRSHFNLKNHEIPASPETLAAILADVGSANRYRHLFIFRSNDLIPPLSGHDVRIHGDGIWMDMVGVNSFAQTTSARS
jgi:hypothetical protein